MAASFNFTFNGTLDFPADTGEPNSQLPFAGQSAATSKFSSTIPLTGSGTLSLDLTSISGLPAAGAKGFLIELDTGSGVSPVNVRVNGGTDDLEVSAGGFVAYYSPTPATGVTQIDVVYTADACVRVTVFG
jgi:hypothetical protein